MSLNNTIIPRSLAHSFKSACLRAQRFHLFHLCLHIKMPQDGFSLPGHLRETVYCLSVLFFLLYISSLLSFFFFFSPLLALKKLSRKVCIVGTPVSNTVVKKQLTLTVWSPQHESRTLRLHRPKSRARSKQNIVLHAKHSSVDSAKVCFL